MSNLAEHSLAILKELSGKSDDGVCDFCGKDTTNMNNSNVYSINFRGHSMSTCSQCEMMMRRGHRLGFIKATMLSGDDAVDLMTDENLALFLAKRIESRERRLAKMRAESE